MYVGAALPEHTHFFVDSVCNHQNKDGATYPHFFPPSKVKSKYAWHGHCHFALMMSFGDRVSRNRAVEPQYRVPTNTASRESICRDLLSIIMFHHGAE